MTDDRIEPEHIKSKLKDIQDEATTQAESAKTNLIAVGAGVGLLLVLLAFVFGRKYGVSKNTVIEVTRN